ncbi:unnamed protein product [Parnassius apollo]|uniref:(apollo) hypothetical protein n=1 Tax=Parnassius apollo TaxID=110799 RepID=A0A8S3XVF3_PARAO|nr:unnamed protein product [Parnassius apollo]
MSSVPGNVNRSEEQRKRPTSQNIATKEKPKEIHTRKSDVLEIAVTATSKANRLYQDAKLQLEQSGNLKTSIKETVVNNLSELFGIVLQLNEERQTLLLQLEKARIQLKDDLLRQEKQYVESLRALMDQGSIRDIQSALTETVSDMRTLTDSLKHTMGNDTLLDKHTFMGKSEDTRRELMEIKEELSSLKDQMGGLRESLVISETNEPTYASIAGRPKAKINKPKDDENETSNHLEQFIIETGDAIHIIAGDLNGWHQLWGSPTANKRGKEIVDIIIPHNLTINNTGTDHTYETTADGILRGSIVDLTITSSSISNHIINWQIDNSICPSSDHHGIKFEYFLNKNHIRQNKKKSTYQYNTNNFKQWGKLSEAFSREIELTQLNKIDILSLDPNNLLHFIDEITAFIHKICKKYLPHSSIRSERPSWWTEDLEKLKRKVLDNHHLLQKLSRKRLPMNEAITNKTQLRKEYAEAIRKASTENFREFCNKQGKEDVWSVTNRLLKNSIPTLPPSTLKIAPNKYTTSSEETAHIFLQKFYPEDTIDTYSSQTVTRQTIKFPPNTNDDPPFTIDEVLHNFKDMNPRKSPGPDHLTSDICFCFTQTFPELITNIMNRCLALSIFSRHIWHSALKYKHVRDKLLSLQRGFAIKIIKGFRTVNTINAIALARLTPIHIKINELAIIETTKLTGTSKYLPTDISLDTPSKPEERLHPSRRKIIHYQEANNAQEVNQILLENTHHIYTDGSRHDEKVGGAFVVYCPNGKIITRKLKLHSSCSVFQAELKAIEQACVWLADKHIPNAAILTDSKSGLQEIGNPNSTNQIVTNIHRMLDNHSLSVNFIWVKAHTGIAGNEAADLAAKAAATSHNVPILIKFPISFVRKLAQQDSKVASEQFYQDNMKGDITRKWLSTLTHIQELYQVTKHSFTLTQILTGHGYHKEYLHRFKIVENNTCPCDDTAVQSIFHLLNDCPKFQATRLTHTITCANFKVQPFSIEEIIKKESTFETFLHHINSIIKSLKKFNGTE